MTQTHDITAQIDPLPPILLNNRKPRSASLARAASAVGAAGAATPVEAAAHLELIKTALDKAIADVWRRMGDEPDENRYAALSAEFRRLVDAADRYRAVRIRLVLQRHDVRQAIDTLRAVTANLVHEADRIKRATDVVETAARALGYAEAIIGVLSPL